MNVYSLVGAISLALSPSWALAQPLPTPSEQMQLEAASSRSTSGPVLVEDESTLAEKQISVRAKELLQRSDYQALDAMAATLRRSTEAYARGDWPIGFFFTGVVCIPKGSSQAEWEAQIQKLRDWFEKDPDCITPRLAMARRLIEYAWEARGNKWAKDVTEEGWRLFGERIAEARRIIKAAENLGTSCPLYYSTRLRLALVDGTSREEYDRLFQESVAAFPTYATFYLVKANYLLPRWHGNEGEWEAFATEAANKIGGENGDILYAQIVWSMHDARYFGNIFKETAVEWSRTERGFQALSRRFPNSISVPSEYCYLAGLAPEAGRSVARRIYAQLDNRVDLSVWKNMERWMSDHRWAFDEH